jgi:hypothetical protein
VIMGGADSAPRADHDAEGAQNGAGGGAKSAPEPSVLQPSGDPTPLPKTLSSQPEPVEFSEWIGHHVTECERHGIRRSVPAAGTSVRADLAGKFRTLLGEGYDLEQLKLASVGVLADEFMRRGGHTAPENVLRKTKIQKRIDDGRAELARREVAEPYAQFDLGDSRV